MAKSAGISLALGALAVALIGIAVSSSLTAIDQATELAALRETDARQRTTLDRIGRQQTAAVGRLQSAQSALAELAKVRAAFDPAIEAVADAWFERAARLKTLADLQTIPECALLTDDDWLFAARDAKFDTPPDVQAALGKVYTAARKTAGRSLHDALAAYASAHDDRLPASLEALAAETALALPAAALARYELLQQGVLTAIPKDEWLLAERPSFVAQFDERLYVSRDDADLEDLTTVSERRFRDAVRAFMSANAGALPEEPAQLLGYFAMAPNAAAAKAFLAKPRSDFSPEQLRKLLRLE